MPQLDLIFTPNNPSSASAEDARVLSAAFHAVMITTIYVNERKSNADVHAGYESFLRLATRLIELFPSSQQDAVEAVLACAERFDLNLTAKLAPPEVVH